jgi:hypothetical protein
VRHLNKPIGRTVVVSIPAFTDNSRRFDLDVAFTPPLAKKCGYDDGVALP